MTNQLNDSFPSISTDEIVTVTGGVTVPGLPPITPPTLPIGPIVRGAADLGRRAYEWVSGFGKPQAR
jgi:hypothetical protein